MYEDIRAFGADAFSVTVLAEYETASEAYAAEAAAIAVNTDGYNISPSHDKNLETAIAALKAKLQDPVWSAEYRARLANGIRASEAHKARYPTLAAAGVKWREENPKQAWKNTYRALRIARQALVGDNSRTWTEAQKLAASELHLKRWAEAPPSVRKKRSITAKSAAKKQWASRTPEQKAAVAAKISATMKAKNAARTPEQKAADDAQLAKARVRIDHDVRRANQQAAFAAMRAQK